MKVLVTGAAGFIGRHVVGSLLAAGHQVVAVVRDPERAASAPWVRQVELVVRDIHQPGDNSWTALGRPDAVMHLAWPGLPDYRKLDHFEKTLPADYAFLKGLIDSGAKHILVTGTCFELGLQNGCLSEQAATAPVTPYGLAKDTLRKFLEFATKGTDVTVQWARLFYMYGPGQHEKSLFSQLEQAIDRNDESFNMSGGEQLRDYLPVGELAAKLVALVGHRECDGTVHVCSGKPISVRALVERRLTERGSTMRLNLGHYPYPEHEPMAFWGDAAKLDAILGRLP